jgi:hypothetical protein
VIYINILQSCVERLVAKNSPSLETMKQQVMFESKLISEHERLEELSRQHALTTKNMLSEVLKFRLFILFPFLFSFSLLFLSPCNLIGRNVLRFCVKKLKNVWAGTHPTHPHPHTLKHDFRGVERMLTY